MGNITNGYQSETPKDAREKRLRYQQLAELQYEFAEAFNAYKHDSSKAADVVKIGEELLQVQKLLNHKSAGRLAQSQVTLRMDYAKQSIAKGDAEKELKASDTSAFKYYENDKGEKVWKIG